MKLQTVSIINGTNDQKGFLTIDALVACAFMALMIPAALALSWSTDTLTLSAQKELTSLATSSIIVSDGVTQQMTEMSVSYKKEFGSVSCTIVPAEYKKGFTSADVYSPKNINFAQNGAVTSASLTVRNRFIYEALDSSSASQPDLFIVDTRIPDNPILVSSLNTGPGLAALTVAGHYIYAANESSVNQLQIIDITHRANPVFVASLKLPLPTASSTAPNARSIFYKNGRIYLGTEKWDGTEFNVVDVSNPLTPVYLGGFETGTLVSDIRVDDSGVAYVADADIEQMRVLNVVNPATISLLSYFSPAGSSVLEGKVVAENEAGVLYFGRAGGGFNNKNQYELFSFDVNADSTAATPSAYQDIPGGVYGVAASGDYVFIASHASSSPLQIWKADLSNEVYSNTMPGVPAVSMMMCDHGSIYFAIPSAQGFAVAEPH